DAREQGPVLLDLGEPGRNAAATDHAIGKLQERLVEDRLAVVAPDDGRVEDHARRRRGDHPRRDTLCRSLFFEILEPALVAAVGAAGRGGKSVLREQGSEDADCCCQYHFSHQFRLTCLKGFRLNPPMRVAGQAALRITARCHFAKRRAASRPQNGWRNFGLLDRGCRVNRLNDRRISMAANLRFSNPKTLAKPPGYSYVVEATGPNRVIFIAGQLGLDMENKLVGAPGDFRAQAEQAVENLKFALADAGATLKDVVKINNYLVDMSHISIFREVRDSHFNMSAPPASTTVAISQLARPGALFEIEAIAVLPAKQAKAGKPAARRGSKKVSARKRKRK